MVEMLTDVGMVLGSFVLMIFATMLTLAFFIAFIALLTAGMNWLGDKLRLDRFGDWLV
ncbi:MAG TPA: hypothetical protein VKA19_10570 [Alphaproteobacteria bacterium]|nr:hypothetical protein [Alphaproteobacteria bacterium]